MAEMNREDSIAFASSMAVVMKEIMDRVGEILPPGTHYAVLIEAQGNGVCQLVGGSTDRVRMSHRAAEWALRVMDTLA